jgi:hypothetical protein
MPRWTRICLLEDIPRPGAHVVRKDNAPNVALRGESIACTASGERPG